MASPATSRNSSGRKAVPARNLFGFGGKKECAPRSSLAFSAAKRQAYAAGSASGARKPKSKDFNTWLCSKGLQDSQRDIVRQLEDEFRRGVRAGGVDTFQASNKIKEIAFDHGYQDAKKDHDRNLSSEEIAEYISGQHASEAWIEKMGKARVASIYKHEYRQGQKKWKAEEKKATQSEARKEKEKVRSEKQEVSEQAKETKEDVVYALVGQGMSRAAAKAAVNRKYRSGDTFEELFRKTLEKRFSKNPLPEGWTRVDSFRTRATASDVASRYSPSKIIYGNRNWQVWTKEATNSNPTPEQQKLERIASEIVKREGVEFVPWRGGKMAGYSFIASDDTKVVRAPRPRNLDGLFILLHEIGHHHYGHHRAGRTEKPGPDEWEATNYALRILRTNGFNVGEIEAEERERIPEQYGPKSGYSQEGVLRMAKKMGQNPAEETFLFQNPKISVGQFIKAPFTDGTHTEHMWVRVTSVDESGRQIKGVLDNKPAKLTNIKLGSQVTIPFSKIERRMNRNPAKFDRCVEHVSRSLKKYHRKGSPYAICQASVGKNPKVVTLRQGRARAEVYRAKLLGSEKFKALVTAPGVAAVSDSFGSLPAAMGWARLHLHEMAHNPAALKAKGSRNPLVEATKVYEEFHGLPSTEVIEYLEQEHHHSVKVGLGKLVCVDVLTQDGREIPLIAPGFHFEPARMLRRDLRHSSEGRKGTWVLDPQTAFDKIIQLTASEDRRQLFFTGGEQVIPYEVMGLKSEDAHDHMFIGTIVEITYRTRKSFEQEGKQEVDFHHEFGSQGSRGVMPLLCYFPRSKRMKVIGGRYEIAPVRKDIGASPGIVG